ncbi:hypothetical protein PR202_gb27883 [Eleusine coracana subsp. coracana]|uniref:MLO-like protein n=1 Tax=Eleusine coracana subsp. coracana TaxID=191504 RepID=A0AAV5FVC6_ELECO|nr:hypothetical protein PR202_gb27883 [Eleusine coracana subsp. coracana]
MLNLVFVFFSNTDRCNFAELMLLGFISFLLSLSQGFIVHICIPETATRFMLPCKKEIHRASKDDTKICKKEGDVPLLSLEALHQLHIFIFVLGLVHVVFCATTILLGGAKMRRWKQWEKKFTVTLRNIAFLKQFYDSVSKSDYVALRSAFVSRHCPGRPNFDFHKYTMRALEHDFKRVVGISWYLWLFVIFFLLLNINGWHTYFWLASLPLFVSEGFGSCMMERKAFAITRLVIGSVKV